MHIIEFGVDAVGFQQFFMCTAFDDLPVVEYADEVGILDGGKPVGDDNGRAVFHQIVKCLLDELFGLGVEGGSRFVENHDGGILEDGAGDAEALALPAAELAATVADDGLIAFFGLHDEVVGIGDAGSLFHLFRRGRFHSESDVIIYGIVEQDGVLVDVAHEFAQIVEGKPADIDAVYEDGAPRDVIEPGQEVHKGAFAGTGLPDEGNCLAFGYGEADVFQHLFAAVVGEIDMAVFDVAGELLQAFRLLRLLDGGFGSKDDIDAVHGGKPFLDAVIGIGQVLGRVDDAVEKGNVGDEHFGREGGVFSQDQGAAEPKDDDNDDGAEELAHGVCQGAPAHQAVLDAAVGFVFFCEPVFHFGFGVKGFDDAQPGEGLFHEGKDFPHFGLSFPGMAFEVFAHFSNQRAHDGEQDEDEKGHFPAHDEHHGEVNQDEDGALEEHVERTHDRGFHFLHVAGHAGDDVAFAFFGKEGQRERQDFEVYFAPDVPYHAVADVNELVCAQVGKACFQGSGDNGDGSDKDEGDGRTVFQFDLGDVIIKKVLEGGGVQCEGHFFRHILLAAEYDAQDGDEHGNGEAAEDSVQEVVKDTFDDPYLIGRDKSFENG